MRQHPTIVTALLIAILLAVAGSSVGQQELPFAPIRGAGQTLTPVFEGWYVNPDGTYSLSFGYFNRNSEEVSEIPIGENNYFEPGDRDRGQPTQFLPRRHWGVFAVTVPADFGNQKLVWTLINHDRTFSIPGSLHRDYQIDALEGEVGANNTPPVVKFAPGGSSGHGPRGIFGPPLTTAVDQPLTLTIWVTDDDRRALFSDKDQLPVILTWVKHRGPGPVTFSNPQPLVDDTADGKATTTATFSEPGDYVLRVLANDASGTYAAGHAQCCWTNGYVNVTATP